MIRPKQYGECQCNHLQSQYQSNTGDGGADNYSIRQKKTTMLRTQLRAFAMMELGTADIGGRVYSFASHEAD